MTSCRSSRATRALYLRRLLPGATIQINPSMLMFPSLLLWMQHQRHLRITLNSNRHTSVFRLLQLYSYGTTGQLRQDRSTQVHIITCPCHRLITCGIPTFRRSGRIRWKHPPHHPRRMDGPMNNDITGRNIISLTRRPQCLGPPRTIISIPVRMACAGMMSLLHMMHTPHRLSIRLCLRHYRLLINMHSIIRSSSIINTTTSIRRHPPPRRLVVARPIIRILRIWGWRLVIRGWTRSGARSWRIRVCFDSFRNQVN